MSSEAERNVATLKTIHFAFRDEEDENARSDLVFASELRNTIFRVQFKRTYRVGFVCFELKLQGSFLY